MAVGKEIRLKISSIRNTQKITRAMEMVAASKMRKVKERMRRARPYAAKVREMIEHLGRAHSEYRHDYLQPRTELKNVGLVVVSTDRGLCGGLNANLFRIVLQRMKEWNAQHCETQVCAIGSKGAGFFQMCGVRLLGQATRLGDAPAPETLLGVLRVMLDAYRARDLDRVFLVSNQFVNSMVQRPLVEQLLPIREMSAREPPGEAAGTRAGLPAYWDYIYEPEPGDVLDLLLQRYVESLVYQAVVENIACEQAARMVAMKSASDNAGKLIDELQLVYNKARQAAITQELAEIMGGAAAL